MKNNKLVHNISYPTKLATVIFGVHISAQHFTGLTENSPQSASACSFQRYD